MKKEEVPQDQSNLSASNMKELCYAVDSEGKYTTELSSGWEPKTIALNKSMEDIQERVDEAKANVVSGKVSPIVYYMELNKMDWVTLAGYMEMWTWRVKRHAKPTVFKKLKQSTLNKYAEVFSISVEDLKNIK